MPRRVKRRLAGEKELQVARDLAVAIREDKQLKKTRLNEVAIHLEDNYSMEIAKYKMDALDIKDVEVQGTLSVRPYNVRQRVPKLTGLIQLDKIKEAINAIKARDNFKLLANWPDYGCATYVHGKCAGSSQPPSARAVHVRLD
ncbi:hypothetical protein DVH05_025815 [Phytophthora capsici]|nr:hypothetical protein DVH05_025815 [Phytophthora capsici]